MKHSNRHALLGLVIGFSYTGFVFFTTTDELDQHGEMKTHTANATTIQAELNTPVKEPMVGEGIDTSLSVEVSASVETVLSAEASSTIVSAN